MVSLTDFLTGILKTIRSLASAIAVFFGDMAQKVLGKIPEEKRRLVLAGLGAGIAVLLVVCVGGALLTKKPEKPDRAAPESNVSEQRMMIPPEELFLPEEPDFIPGVLLDRDKRTAWTAEDAAPYWQDPLKNGEEQWRERIEMEIDEYLERVP